MYLKVRSYTRMYVYKWSSKQSIQSDMEIKSCLFANAGIRMILVSSYREDRYDISMLWSKKPASVIRRLATDGRTHNSLEIDNDILYTPWTPVVVVPAYVLVAKALVNEETLSQVPFHARFSMYVLCIQPTKILQILQHKLFIHLIQIPTSFDTR